MSQAAGLDLSARPDLQAAAILFASDPHGLGGIAVRSRAGPVRDHWLSRVRALLPDTAPWRRLPIGTAEERLYGGLDLAATLAAARPVMERGLLADSDGGVIVLPMAERLPEPVAAGLAAALDTGLGPKSDAARFGLLALDEGLEDEGLSARLQDRLAFWTDLSDYDPAQAWPDAASALVAGRANGPRVAVGDAAHRALTEAAVVLGIASLRPLILALRVARAAAAVAGRDAAAPEDIALAARLVLAPRATRLPQSPAEPQSAKGTEPEAGQGAGAPDSEPADATTASVDLGDLVLSAAKAALPPGLLLRLQAAAGRTTRHAPGRAGAVQTAPTRGRPVGVRRGGPRGGRLSLIETLRAAAPWQRVRRSADEASPTEKSRIAIRRDDFRFTRFKQRTETVTLFAVDASGSLALNRLAEAKGAVELLLAECYVRRDQVALLAFRGTGTELVLPPTRSLARAKRCLADLAGGGATPLASAIDDAIALADQIRRRGRTPVVVFLTDGRGNVARDGTLGRARAEADARMAAVLAGTSGLQLLVIDAAPRPQAPAQALAAAMNAGYLPLPRAEATALTAAIRTMTLA